MALVTKCCKRRIAIKWNGGKQTNICSNCNKKIKLRDLVEKK